MKTFKKFLESILDDPIKMSKTPCKDVEEELKNISFEDSMFKRKKFVKDYSWSIICKEVIEKIKQYASPPIFDVMAGTGWMGKILSSNGIRVISSDLHIGKNNKYGHHKTHDEISEIPAIEKMKEIAILAKNGETRGDIILSWPPYEESLGYDILKLVSPGAYVFYFGEGMYGCTGDDEMHSLLNNPSIFTHVETFAIPQFDSIHDSLFIYKKTA